MVRRVLSNLIDCFVLIIIIHATAAYAQELGVNSAKFNQAQIPGLQNDVAAVQRRLTILQQSLDKDALNELIADNALIKQQAQKCISHFETENKKLDDSLKLLAGETTDHSEEKAVDDKDEKVNTEAVHDNEARLANNQLLANKRNEIKEKQTQIDDYIAQCRVLIVETEDIDTQAKSSLQFQLTRRLSSRTPNALDSVQTLIDNPVSAKDTVNHLQSALTTLKLDWQNVYISLFYALVGLVLGSIWSGYKKRQIKQNTSPSEYTSPTLHAVWYSILNLMPLLLSCSFITLALIFYPVGLNILGQVFLTLFSFTLAYAIARVPLTTSGQEALPNISPIDNNSAKKVHFWVGLLLPGCLLMLILSAFPLSLTQRPTLNLSLILIGTSNNIALLSIIWLLKDHFNVIAKLRLHWISTLVLVPAILALWLGYHNVAYDIMLGSFGTLLVLLLLWLLLRSATDIYDGLDEGHTQWQRYLRQRAGLTAGQYFPGLIWLRLATLIILNVFAFTAILRFWGVSEQSISLSINNLINGLQFGDMTLEPARIILGILTIGLGLSLTQVLKKQLSQNWLKRTRLSRGAREASVTVSGYIGVTLTILLGLSIAGLQLQNLAIIAGALSVGIGFGLQNIVNNFVSGLILLFERPVRRGDWIRVGGAEGYVRDISIRSTTIQNFDHADIIVPNSELISGQVTNMFLNDSFGRIIIPIKVAYGSSVDEVIRLLTDIALQKEEVIKHKPDMQPIVLFRRFGDYALEFELRCYIRQIDSMLSIISQMNIIIERTFREQGITIPYPQQHLTIQHRE